jgi:hypothetical protein
VVDFKCHDEFPHPARSAPPPEEKLRQYASWAEDTSQVPVAKRGCSDYAGAYLKTPVFDGSRQHVVLVLGSTALQILPTVSCGLWGNPDAQCRSAHLTHGDHAHSITAPISGKIFADNRG